MKCVYVPSEYCQLWGIAIASGDLVDYPVSHDLLVTAAKISGQQSLSVLSHLVITALLKGLGLNLVLIVLLC